MGIQIIDLKELLESLIVLVINFKMIIKRYKKRGVTAWIKIRQSAYLVVNSITVYSYDFLFNCTTMGQALDLMTAMAYALIRWLVPGACRWLGLLWLNLRLSLALTICES